MKNPPIQEDPESTAIAVLGWLAQEPDMLARFLALTGVQPSEMRSAASDPGFLGAMLDFILQHEPTLMAFCSATETQPEVVAAAYYHYVRPGLDSGEF